MRTINPVGRDFNSEHEADYSTLSTRCKCTTNTSQYTNGKVLTNCSCSDGNGTVGTRVYATY